MYNALQKISHLDSVHLLEGKIENLPKCKIKSQQTGHSLHLYIVLNSCYLNIFKLNKVFIHFFEVPHPPTPLLKDGNHYPG